MAGGDETLAAATAILQGLATEVPRTPSSSAPSDVDASCPSVNGFETKIKLPGESSPAKEAFEKELEALIHRIHLLEERAVSALFQFSPSRIAQSSRCPRGGRG